jgi:hypothetical protein
MSLFGSKEEDKVDKSAALQVAIDRLDALPMSKLATEVMTKGFGPGGPGADPDDTVTIGGSNVNAGATVGAIGREFFPVRDAPGVDQSLWLRLDRLVAEGVQALEHGSLVRIQSHPATSLDYALTRSGRAALEQGAVEQVLGGGGN